MRSVPIPRAEIFDIYWYFAFERNRIFERRVAGQPGPWTSDPILREFKFCNVFRAADRVSQYLISEVAYGNDVCSAADRVFRIVAFRLFSKIETWRSVRHFLGRQPTLDDLRDGSFGDALERARRENGGLYTGAFILCATNAYGLPAKHLNHVALLRHMFLQGRVAEQLLNATALRDVYEIIRRYPLMGDFMSYQIAIDLNYSELINFSENDFTKPGPGALRGIKKVFEDLHDYSPAEVILWMVERQEYEFSRLGLTFSGLWGRPLHAIDCQGLFCEVDKYCREAKPFLQSSRKRIKSRFAASREELTLFFPPKWGINERIRYSGATS